MLSHTFLLKFNIYPVVIRILNKNPDPATQWIRIRIRNPELYFNIVEIEYNFMLNSKCYNAMSF